MDMPEYLVRFAARDGGRQVRAREVEWVVVHDEKIVEPRTRARLSSIMRLYCENGPVDMHEKMFKFIEHFSLDGRRVRLEEFKAGAVRLFGFSGRLSGVTAFFVTGIDVAKKQPKANRRLLDKAGAEAVRVLNLIEGTN